MANDWQRIWDAFHTVTEAAPDDREATLERVCGDDRSIRAELESLLAAADQKSDFLDRPAVAALEGSMDAGGPGSPGLGTSIGPYRLVGLLGEGGMGVVYRAEQESPIRREVALKLIRGGFDSSEVVARFEAERQALAMMKHPNIAMVFDAGTSTDNRPYFVMELAQGSHITSYCDQHRLGIRDRISLIVKVCRAVQHAHRMGIIHRDLKPSNIIVHGVDGEHVPKVIDFGVQKATDPDHGAQAPTSEHSVIGTPEYMSPEQWEPKTAIDTRTDVYSLGMLLYQILTGRLPFDWNEEDGLRVLLKDLAINDPPSASTRVAAQDDRGERVAGLRSTDPGALRRRLRGELDWIAMKAIARDRNERYQSAAELADELERHLHNQPILAAPRTVRYQLRSLARRHRVALVAGSAVIAAMVIGLISTTGGLVAARKARAEAEQQAAIAEGVNRFLNQDLLGAVDPERSGGRDVTVREVVDLAAARLEKDLEAPPALEAGIRDTLGSVYFSLGEYGESIEMLEPALEIRRNTLGAERAETLTTAVLLGRAYRKAARLEEAEPLFVETSGTARRVLGAGHPVTLDVSTELATLYQEQGRMEEAEARYRQVLEIRRQHDNATDLDAAMVLNNLASLVTAQGRYDEAGQLMQESLAIHRDVLGSDHLRTVAVSSNLAAIYQGAGRYAEAVPLHRESLAALQRILGPDHDRTLVTRLNLASSLGWVGRHTEAEALAGEALEGLRRTLGENHALSLVALRGLAVIIDRQGRSSEAEALFAEAVAGARLHLPQGHWYTGVFLSQYGRCLTNLGRYSEAEQALLEAIDIIEPVLDPVHTQRVEAVENLVTLYERWGRANDSRAWREKLAPGS